MDVHVGTIQVSKRVAGRSELTRALGTVQYRRTSAGSLIPVDNDG